MKTMTCKDMGGTCDAAMTAATAEEMMKMGGDHVNEMAGKDAAHAEAKVMMEKAGTDPAMMAEWKKMFMAKWDAAPEAPAATM